MSTPTTQTTPGVPARPAVSHRAPRERSVWSYIGGGLGNLLAAGGVICVVMVVLAVSMNISLIMFKTGSMSPEIPAGSVAVVREIPADHVQVGDVVTVDRGEDQLPVTHRVVEIHPQTEGEVLLRMQGDANPNPDPGMYRVETVREVLWSVPRLANVIVWLGNPYVLGGITVVAALGVLWAFWPRRSDMAATDKDDEADRRNADDQDT